MNGWSNLLDIAVMYAIGLVASTVVWRWGRGIFAAEVFERRNYRDHPLPTAVGVLLPIVAAVGVASAAVTWRGRFLDWSTGPAVVELAVAFSFLGLIDDLGGTGESGGFSGHLRALAGGRITTGLIKMIGGPVFAIVVLWSAMPSAGVVDLLRDAAVVSLAANLANLFDRAPGRTNKVGQLMLVVVFVATQSAGLAPVALVMGAAAGLLIPDLREELMIGDAGSNVIGSVLGLGVVVSTAETQRWAVLGGLLVANLASEFVSFSKLIDAAPPLRSLDRLGAPHRPR